MNTCDTDLRLAGPAIVRAARRYVSLLVAVGIAGALALPPPAAGAQGDPSSRVVGRRWAWQQTQMSDGAVLAPDAPGGYTLELLPDGQVAVQADCNRGAGGYTLEGNRITIGPLAVTRAACPPGSLGDPFLAQLGMATSYFLDGPYLFLELPFDSGTMRFVAPVQGGAGQRSDEGAATVALLEGTPWTLIGYVSADGTTRPVLAGTEVTAIFQDGRLAGSAGCNAYASGYNVTGSAISLTGPAAATLRLCPEPPGIMEQEAAYLAALERIARLNVTPRALTLLDGDGAILLTYVPQAQTPLEGTAWTAQAYNNGRGGVVTLIAGTEITARFEGGRVAGSAGCNTYTAAYSLNGNAIEISPAASTRMACATPPGIMEQEAAYLAALQTARVYRTEGSRLILETADGARVATFVPAAGAGAPAAPAALVGDNGAKITFDPGAISEAGLAGPPDGLVAVAYEFCIPATPTYVAEVQRIDPTVRTQPGSPGRIGCRPGAEVLCVGSTHQPGWRSVLQQLAALDYVARIDRHVAE
jgi:heat shock protein HslJ